MCGHDMKNIVLPEMESGLNGLGSNSHGLILWENDATGPRIILLKSIWPPAAKKVKKYAQATLG